jgi:alkanesulfonate monooxygenase SsuD/methylene tetrahydromethanopterin reductase-like flavin-dependent oxidoreductase (luciferase family)
MSRLEAASSRGLRRAVELAESADLDGLGLGDHVSFGPGAGADGLVGATSVLAASERLSAVIGVYLLPLRHPVLVARQVMDISTLAPGRLVLGVGIGGEDPHEFEICDVDPRTRGRRMDECLTVVRALLRGGAVDFDGEFFHVENATLRPGLVEPVPILVGGRSEAAIRRAGRHGDGWFGIWVSASRYAQAIEQMHHAAGEVGREQASWQNALNVWCGIGSRVDKARGYVASAMEDFYRIPYERFEKWSPAGSPEQIAEFLVPYVEAGCHTFNLIACGESPEAEIGAVGEIRKRLADSA